MRALAPFTERAEAFFSAAVPADKRMVLLIKAFFDETGTNDSAHVAAFTGCLSSPVRWCEFIPKLSALLAKHHLPHFHFTDFIDGKSEDYRGIGADDKLELLSGFMGAVKAAVDTYIGHGVIVSHYNRLPARARMLLTNPYTISASSALSTLFGMMVKDYPGDTLAVVCEKPQKGHGRVARGINWVSKVMPEVGEMIHSVTWANKKQTPELQAADAFGWLFRRYHTLRLGLDSRKEYDEIVDEHMEPSWVEAPNFKIYDIEELKRDIVETANDMATDPQLMSKAYMKASSKGRFYPPQ